MLVTFRNVITGDHHNVSVRRGRTVRQSVESAGIIAPGNHFSVRDQDGTIVDGDQAVQYEGKVLHIGPRGNIQGGRAEYRR